MLFRRVVVITLAAFPLAFSADVRVVEEIAAKVNGDIITRGELEKTLKDNEQALRADGYTGSRLTDALNQVQSNALRDQIDQLLLVQKGKDLNINVDGELNREITRLQVESKITDPDKFYDYVREQTGMPFEDYRDFVKRKMLSQRVIGQEVSYRINIPEADLKKYYEEHKSEYVRKEAQVFLSQILLSTEGKTPEQVASAEKKAQDLVVRARKGEKFSDLVRANSDDVETARNGGQLPPLTRELLNKQIADVVFKLDRGSITDPIKVPQGLLILKVEERTDAGQATYEEVKNDIQEKLAAPKMEPKIREYLTRLRQEAFLQIKEGYTDTGAALGKDTTWRDQAQLKPQTTTKEEVASRIHRHKKLLFIPIPGTTKKTTPADTTSPAAPTAPAATPTAPATPPKQ